MVTNILTKIFGSRNDRLLKQYRSVVARINALEPQFEKLSDDQLRGKTQEFRDRLAKGETLEALLPEAFAVVREGSKRVMKMRHFDVQLIGGIALHQGKIAEMRTGEGKTLTATLPVYLNALSGQGVHVVTVNDYLARRDAVRDPVYDRYASINRHQLTPTGWIHWQDNTKMMPDASAEGGLNPVVQEYVLNTYDRFDGYNTGAADAYWAATKDYWAAVRDMWADVAEANGGITIEEEAETGTVISGRLLTIGNELQEGTIAQDAAIAEARALIGEATAPAQQGAY